MDGLPDGKPENILPPQRDVYCRWVAGDWQACSRSCGDGAVTRRDVYCIRETSDLSLQPVDHRLCLSEDRPHTERPCAAHVDCPTWVAGQWSHVSV